MSIHDRSARKLVSTAFFVLAGSVLILAAPAEARLRDPGPGGPISGGFFSGLPVRAQAQAERPAERGLTGVAGDNCYVVRQAVRDRMGGTVLRTVRVCD